MKKKELDEILYKGSLKRESLMLCSREAEIKNKTNNLFLLHVFLNNPDMGENYFLYMADKTVDMFAILWCDENYTEYKKIPYDRFIEEFTKYIERCWSYYQRPDDPTNKEEYPADPKALAEFIYEGIKEIKLIDDELEELSHKDSFAWRRAYSSGIYTTGSVWRSVIQKLRTHIV